LRSMLLPWWKTRGKFKLKIVESVARSHTSFLYLNKIYSVSTTKNSVHTSTYWGHRMSHTSMNYFKWVGFLLKGRHRGYSKRRNSSVRNFRFSLFFMDWTVCKDLLKKLLAANCFPIEAGSEEICTINLIVVANESVFASTVNPHSTTRLFSIDLLESETFPQEYRTIWGVSYCIVADQVRNNWIGRWSCANLTSVGSRSGSSPRYWQPDIRTIWSEIKEFLHSRTNNRGRGCLWRFVPWFEQRDLFRPARTESQLHSLL